MAAVLGGDETEVLGAIEAAGLYPANRNGAGQIVAAGPVGRPGEALRRTTGQDEDHQAPGRRRVPHPAHGARRDRARRHRRRHHTDRSHQDPALQPGRGRRRPRRHRAHPARPSGHRTGAVGPVHGVPWPTSVSPRSSNWPRPARWRDWSSARSRASRSSPSTPPTTSPRPATRSPGTARTPTHEPHPEFRVVVAGTGGTFVPAAGIAEGDEVGDGQVIGAINTRQGSIEVSAHGAGVARRVAGPRRRPGGARPAAGAHRRHHMTFSFPAPAAGSRIVSLGHYQPSRVVTNNDLATIVDTDDAWIRDRVGIAERRIAESESVADMATFAAEKALANVGVDRRRHRHGVRRHVQFRGPVPERGRPGRAAARHRGARARWTSTPPAPASATAWRPPITRSAPAPPATRW